MTFTSSKDRIFTNWVDFINNKFSDNQYFQIDIIVDERRILIHSKTNSTKIWFYFSDENLALLEDYHFTSDNCKSWSGESEIWNDKIKFGTFNKSNLDKLENWLETPLYRGWYSVDNFLLNRLIKTTAYYDSNKRNIISTQHDSSFTIITVLIFPIFILLRFLVDKELIGKKVTTYVLPIIGAEHHR